MMNQKHSVSPFLPRIVPCTLLFLLAAVCAGTLSAAEVYTWTDENGVVHFSDSPRESGDMQTLEVDEIYRPGSAEAHTAPAQEQATADSEEPDEVAEAAAAQSVAEQRREEIAQQREDRAQQQAEIDRLCAMHRQRLEQMEPARRVFYTNAEGESVRMDDDQRMALIDESKAYLSQNCGG